MIRYALTIFLSSFLLFQVQPLIGKFILPWFGGSPAVWTTCMLSFQVLLLVGYSYAHFIADWLTPRRQGLLHIVLLLASLAVLPIIPDETWKPLGNESPTWRIMVLLTVCIGGPYLLLSSTGPLLQSWFSRTHPGKSPYRLYALSNVGSLLALISYPFAFEPMLRLAEQAWGWSIAYVVFTVLCGICAVSLIRFASLDVAQHTGGSDSEQTPTNDDIAEPPGWVNQLLWLALAACGSVILLATTNQMCQEVAVVPFLWVLPLSLYLVTFIICFDNEQWYKRLLFTVVLIPSMAGVCCLLLMANDIPLLLQIIIYSVAMFVCCMICHGELVKLKPHPRYLTKFYLMIAAGGALGGVLTTLGAPLVFTDYLEYHFGLVACCVLFMVCVYRDPDWFLYRGRPVWAWTGLLALFAWLLVFLSIQSFTSPEKIIAKSRNFYGTLRVAEFVDKYEKPYYSLRHGRIMHGFQFLADEYRSYPTSYYGPESGAGLAVRFHPGRMSEQKGKSALRIGAVGLGVGTMAVYGRPGDMIRFYEINPEVIRMAQEYFSFCTDSKSQVDIVLGDARVSLERQLRDKGSEDFDVLVVDAFSSDSIPMHLLTKECFELYRKHLKPDGIMAVHISNIHLDLGPLIRGLAAEIGLEAVLFENDSDTEKGVSPSHWVLITNNREFLDLENIKKFETTWPDDSKSPVVWTDDFSNLFELLKLD